MEECLVRTEVTVIANNQSAVVSQPSLSKNPVLRKPFVHLCLGSLRVGLVVISSRFAFVRFVARGSRAGEWVLANVTVTRNETSGSRCYCQLTDSRRPPAQSATATRRTVIGYRVKLRQFVSLVRTETSVNPKRG
jgi:hypothetical protein